MYHRAGKVKRLTPKENKKEKRKEAVGRAKKRRKFNRSQLPPTVSLNRYKNKRQDGKDNTEPFFSLWAPKKTTTWSPASSVSFDLWYPVFNSPSDKYTNEISHHQEGHPRIRLHKEDQKQKISELTELVGSLNINESSENVPQFVVHK
eukprot:TRINITY_DN7019_c0_g1_i3.p1 TRINITY_DN7019_c0_g1~~TRINITY_DN7019_c0_g1_i3.p1  ORF type:complete len:148 (-),score=28.84 TRINITY_DN7019_c0_g1_i3:122-565(-)